MKKSFVLALVGMLSLGLLFSCGEKIENPVSVTEVSLNKSEVSLLPGEFETLIVTYSPDNAWDKVVNWSTSDRNVATIDSDGKVTAISPGTARITAESPSDSQISDYCDVTVLFPQLEGPTLTMTTAKTGEFTMIMNHADWALIEWGDGESTRVIPSNAHYAHTYSGAGPHTISITGNITEFYCDGWELTALDVSENTELITLGCSDNRLTGLDLSGNTALKELFCNDNQLSELDLSGNPALVRLECRNNRLTELDLSRNPALTNLYCINNQITSMDVSACPVLESLSCYNNALTGLDVTANPVLERLVAANMALTDLDVSGNPALTELSVGNNQLKELDLRGNPALTYLWCDENRLTGLDLSGNPALTQLYCDTNLLTALDLSKNSALKTLECPYNQLEELNVSGCDQLTSLNCDSNQLKAGALDAVFTALPEVQNGVISFRGNPGVGNCNPDIAYNKGWKNR